MLKNKSTAATNMVISSRYCHKVHSDSKLRVVNKLLKLLSNNATARLMVISKLFKFTHLGSFQDFGKHPNMLRNYRSGQLWLRHQVQRAANEQNWLQCHKLASPCDFSWKKTKKKGRHVRTLWQNSRQCKRPGIWRTC